MAESSLITVEIVYADADHPRVQSVDVPAGTTVMMAIELSGITDQLPRDAIDPMRLGIFSKHVSTHHVVKHGDRIEIYRPLRIDPMEARRRRALGK